MIEEISGQLAYNLKLVENKYIEAQIVLCEAQIRRVERDGWLAKIDPLLADLALPITSAKDAAKVKAAVNAFGKDPDLLERAEKFRPGTKKLLTEARERYINHAAFT